MDFVTRLDEKLAELESSASGTLPKLLLHCCCAPCASYVLEYLSPFFKITAFFYNPNIMPRAEHDKRAAELDKLLSTAEYKNAVDSIKLIYSGADFDESLSPFMDEPEGGQRCAMCFALRLEETAKQAAAMRYDYFTTTLSVSPHKNAAMINNAGGETAKQKSANFLIADFKKKGGYQRTIELSKQYGLYRQNYCGCVRP